VTSSLLRVTEIHQTNVTRFFNFELLPIKIYVHTSINSHVTVLSHVQPNKTFTCHTTLWDFSTYRPANRMGMDKMMTAENPAVSVRWRDEKRITEMK